MPWRSAVLTVCAAQARTSSGDRLGRMVPSALLAGAPTATGLRALLAPTLNAQRKVPDPGRAQHLQEP